jgi:hypothetical protein
MKTIEIYEQTETNELQMLLKQFETYLDNGEILLNRFEKENYDEYLKLKKKMNDCDIDVHLIRMELNKRFWLNS